MSIDWNSALKGLFCEYADSGNRLDRKSLSFLEFQNLLADAHVLCPSVTSSSVELLFYSETKRRPQMSFEVFLNTLPRLAQLKYRETYARAPKEALNSLLEHEILPLCNSRVPARPPCETKILPLNNDVKDIFASIVLPFKRLYKAYFPWESSHNMTNELKLINSSKALQLFLRQFGLCPGSVPKSTVFKY